jgi:hypothetical protein
MRLIQTLKQVNIAHVVALGAAVAGLIIFLFTSSVFADGDTYWHLATGRWIIEHGRIPMTDPFSYTAPGREWQAHEWLADVFMWGAYSLGGWTALTVVFGLAAAAAAGLFAGHISRSLGGLTLPVLVIMAMLCTTQSVLVRPHALMLPLLIFWTIQVMDARERDKAPPLALAAVMIIWANLHGSYVFGFVIAGAFGLEALWEAPKERRLIVFRDWAIFGAASLVAVLITPHGVAGVIFPFQVMTLSILKDIQEWRPTDMAKFSPFLVSLLLALLVMFSRGTKIKPMRALLLVALFYMALAHRRHLIVLALVAPLIMAEPLAISLGQKRKEGAPNWRAPRLAFLALAVIVCAYRFIVPVQRHDDRVTPASALRSVPASLRAQPVLNDYSMGGYLIFNGVKVYIDGRADMYGDEFVGEYMDLIHRGDQAKLQAILDKRHITWTMFNPGDLLVRSLDKQPGWRRLYTDKWTVVHVRIDAVPPAPAPSPAPAK